MDQNLTEFFRKYSKTLQVHKMQQQNIRGDCNCLIFYLLIGLVWFVMIELKKTQDVPVLEFSIDMVWVFS